MVKQFIRVIGDSLRNSEKEKHENEAIPSQPEVEIILPECHQEKSEPNPPATIDASTGEIIQDDSPSDGDTESALASKQEEIAKKLRGHPEDIIKLAAINEAFYKGILALQHLNLDEDLYWQALEDLRNKYYRVRSQSLASSHTNTKE